jgi:hypothetical protein
MPASPIEAKLRGAMGRLRTWVRRIPALVLVGPVACGGDVGAPPAPVPCGEECADEVALRAVREMTKLAYNLLLQGKPVGEQDARSPCPLGGSVHVFGNATSNAAQGATAVALTYEFSSCGHLELDEEPEETYRMTLTGTLTQSGTIAAQPTATTALVMTSESMSMEGTVHDPPVAYGPVDCAIAVSQDGNDLSGLVCDKEVGVDLGGQN